MEDVEHIALPAQLVQITLLPAHSALLDLSLSAEAVYLAKLVAKFAATLISRLALPALLDIMLTLLEDALIALLLTASPALPIPAQAARQGMSLPALLLVFKCVHSLVLLVEAHPPHAEAVFMDMSLELNPKHAYLLLLHATIRRVAHIAHTDMFLFPVTPILLLIKFVKLVTLTAVDVAVLMYKLALLALMDIT